MPTWNSLEHKILVSKFCDDAQNCSAGRAVLFSTCHLVRERPCLKNVSRRFFVAACPSQVFGHVAYIANWCSLVSALARLGACDKLAFIL